jgi:hypothetical protein
MAGYQGEGAAAVFSGATLYPSELTNSGHWQINDTYLFLFGGYSNFGKSFMIPIQ